METQARRAPTSLLAFLAQAHAQTTADIRESCHGGQDDRTELVEHLAQTSGEGECTRVGPAGMPSILLEGLIQTQNMHMPHRASLVQCGLASR